jgi:hypothetical protein
MFIHAREMWNGRWGGMGGWMDEWAAVHTVLYCTGWAACVHRFVCLLSGGLLRQGEICRRQWRWVRLSRTADRTELIDLTNS